MIGFLSALASLFSIKAMLLMAFGTALGIVFGALPGLTAVMGVALLMPLTFQLPSSLGLPMLLGVYCGGIYGGAITAILIRTPGTPASAATVLDGYPMAKNGKAGEALSTATIASWFGGLFSAIIAVAFAPLLGKAALGFGPIEYFALVMVGIILIGYLSSDNMLKGLMSALLGFIIGCIGLDPVLGLPRLTFGNSSLYSGISIIPAVIGLFAISEVFNLIEKMYTEKSEEFKLDKIKVVAMKEFFKHTALLIKSSIIGTIIGIIPAVGSGTAAWIAYGEAKRASKNPELFGKGSLEGIMASESSNNAVTGGAIIPLLSLGIPGDSVTAVLYGGLMIQGLRPGPMFFQKSMDTANVIFAALFIVNFMMLFMGLLGVKGFAYTLRIPKPILAALILVLSIIGCYAISGNMMDVKIAILLGIIGYLLTKINFPVPPMVLALVLAPLFEQSLRRAMIITKGNIFEFFKSPVALGLYAMSVLMIIGLSKRKRTNITEN